jgi:hypothetical protein
VTVGPGKYDDLATYVREQTQARGVVVIVIDGKHGNGFSVQITEDLTIQLPMMLLRLADEIEKDTA